MTWMRIEDEIQRLKATRDGYGAPVVLGLVGVLLATVGGVWSLYL